jgi:hypothetical protein
MSVHMPTIGSVPYWNSINAAPSASLIRKESYVLQKPSPKQVSSRHFDSLEAELLEQPLGVFTTQYNELIGAT